MKKKPQKNGNKIETLYAIISTNREGEQGICGGLIAHGMMSQFITADLKLLEFMKKECKEEIKKYKGKIEILQFKFEKSVEELK